MKSPLKIAAGISLAMLFASLMSSLSAAPTVTVRSAATAVGNAAPVSGLRRWQSGLTRSWRPSYHR